MNMSTTNEVKDWNADELVERIGRFAFEVRESRVHMSGNQFILSFLHRIDEQM